MRVAVISDIHANADALAAVLQHIPADRDIWFLGDAVGYYPDFRIVLDQLEGLYRSKRLQYWIKGNHDFAAHVADISQLRFSDIAHTAILLTRDKLTPGQKRLLQKQ